MTSTHMPKGIEYALVSENAISCNNVFDNCRINWLARRSPCLRNHLMITRDG
jgi:hypothetical protein